ncbi:MAG: peptidylprolyl isomerase [Sphingobacteriales bacterium]|nr:MAG: peptidylprolyl isomerase [Sphingobacteriales bacterium]
MKKSILLVLLLSLGSTAFAQKNKVRIETVYGPIVIALYDGTPLHRDNFLKLTKERFYDSLLWHRVIPGFVIQGGDPDSKHAKPGAPLGEGEYGQRIPAEIKPEYFHKRGAVGMARDNNPNKESSGCQFYIVIGKPFDNAALDKAQQRSGHTLPEAQRAVYHTLGGTPHLDGNYTVFGEVISGMAAADSIAAQPRNAADRPNTDSRILSIRKVRKKFLGIF